MKTATLTEIRNEFPRIEVWIREGESVNISKRGKVIARLIPVFGALEGFSDDFMAERIQPTLQERSSEHS